MIRPATRENRAADAHADLAPTPTMATTRDLNLGSSGLFLDAYRMASFVAAAATSDTRVGSRNPATFAASIMARRRGWVHQIGTAIAAPSRVAPESANDAASSRSMPTRVSGSSGGASVRSTRRDGGGTTRAVPREGGSDSTSVWLYEPGAMAPCARRASARDTPSIDRGSFTTQCGHDVASAAASEPRRRRPPFSAYPTRVGEDRAPTRFGTTVASEADRRATATVIFSEPKSTPSAAHSATRNAHAVRNTNKSDIAVARPPIAARGGLRIARRRTSDPTIDDEARCRSSCFHDCAVFRSQDEQRINDILANVGTPLGRSRPSRAHRRARANTSRAYPVSVSLLSLSLSLSRHPPARSVGTLGAAAKPTPGSRFASLDARRHLRYARAARSRPRASPMA